MGLQLRFELKKNLTIVFERVNDLLIRVITFKNDNDGNERRHHFPDKPTADHAQGIMLKNIERMKAEYAFHEIRKASDTQH